MKRNTAVLLGRMSLLSVYSAPFQALIEFERGAQKNG